MPIKFVSISVTPQTRADLQVFAAELGGQARRRVSLSDALAAAVAIAGRDLPAAAQVLTDPSATTDDPEGDR